MHGQSAIKRVDARSSSRIPDSFPRSPNSSGSSASSTKRLRASPPPKPTPKRTSKTPAPSSKATSNPSSPSAARGGWRERLEKLASFGDGNHSSNYPTREELVEAGIPFIRAANIDRRPSCRTARMRFADTRKTRAAQTRSCSRRDDVLIIDRRDDRKDRYRDELRQRELAFAGIASASMSTNRNADNRFSVPCSRLAVIQTHLQSCKERAQRYSSSR